MYWQGVVLWATFLVWYRYSTLFWDSEKALGNECGIYRVSGVLGGNGGYDPHKGIVLGSGETTVPPSTGRESVTTGPYAR